MRALAPGHEVPLFYATSRRPAAEPELPTIMTESILPARQAHAEDAHPTGCENCGTPLQGQFCHSCGQSAHNPLKNFGHAVEEVFESFWHLDGRVFRTLRDLQIPGLTAKNYLAGRRVGYMPPLRLFMILTLFAFFVGKLMLHSAPAIDIGAIAPKMMSSENGSGIETQYAKRIAAATTAAEVDTVLAEASAELRARAEANPGDTKAAAASETAINELSDVADLRKLTLPGGEHADDDKNKAAADKREAPTKSRRLTVFSDDAGKEWDPHSTPVQVTWLPGFVNRWLTTRGSHVQQNIHAIKTNPAILNQMALAGIAAIPSALFLLVPVFALLLKLIYINRGISYLEHLVVALYSHAWLMLAMLSILLLTVIGSAAGGAWKSVLGVAGGLVWAWIPVYLLLMQRRVYGGSWATLLLRYGAIGVLYFMLVTFVAVYAVFAGLSM